MLAKRIVTAIILIPLFLGAMLYLPEKEFVFFIVLSGLIGSVEFSLMFFSSSRFEVFFFVLVVSLSIYLRCVPGGTNFSQLSGVGFLLFAALAIFGSGDGERRYKDFSTQMIGFLYFVTFFPYAYQLKKMERGGWLLIFIAITVYIGDSAAYFVGRRFGKMKLAPFVSPGKTVEGALASTLFGTLAGCLYLHYVYRLGTFSHHLILSLLVSCVGQGGDLVESLFKRAAKVKDSGRIFPGHGGFLDRVDSFVLNPLIVVVLIGSVWR